MTGNTCSARLTLGLMGLDELHLRVLSTSSDDEKERANAKKGAISLDSKMRRAHFVSSTESLEKKASLGSRGMYLCYFSGFEP